MINKVLVFCLTLYLIKWSQVLTKFLYSMHVRYFKVKLLNCNKTAISVLSMIRCHSDIYDRTDLNSSTIILTLKWPWTQAYYWILLKLPHFCQLQIFGYWWLFQTKNWVLIHTCISYPDPDQVHEMYLLFICNIQCYLRLSCGVFIGRWAI
jgi:hypothetical protein